MASFALSVIRGVFALADHVAPRLTGRLAFELFCRPPKPGRLSERERKVIADAAGFMAQARLHRFPVGTDCVVAYEFRPPSGRFSQTVLVLHGWGSRSEHMRLLIDGLSSAGCRVIALDLPGHGKSLGRRLNMAKAVQAVSTTAQWFGPFTAMLGHSFGGAVAVNAAVGSVRGVNPVAADRLVLVAAPSSMPAIFEDFGRFLNLGPRTQIAVAEQVERIAGYPLESYVGTIQLAEHPVESLVIHSADDKEVSPDHARRFAGAGTHVRLAWVNGLGHRRILFDPAVAAQAVDFAIGVAAERAVPQPNLLST
jgi:pimeloyl-ACP methyl ester carboxylesterase